MMTRPAPQPALSSLPAAQLSSSRSGIPARGPAARVRHPFMRLLPVVSGLWILCMAALPRESSAATQYATGTLTWDNATTAAWGAVSGGPYIDLWTSGNDAVLEGTAGTLNVAASGATAHNLTFNTPGFTIAGTANFLMLAGTTPTVTLDLGITGSVISILAGTDGLIKAGAGTLTLNNLASTFSGGITVSGGVLAIPNDGSLGAAANGVTLSAGGTLRLTATTTLSAARVITVNGSAGSPSGINLGNSITVTLGATQLTGSGTALFTRTGGSSTSTLSVEGDNAGFTGPLIVGAHGQMVGDLLSQRSFTNANGATLRLQNAGTLPGATQLTFNNTAALTITQPTTAVTGRISTTAPLTFHSGRILYNPSANGNAAINETFGTVNVTGLMVATGSTVVGPTAGTTLNFGALTRTDRATLLFRAPVSGQGTIGGPVAATSVRYFFSGLTPDTTSSGTTRSVIPWAGNVTGTTGSFNDNLMTYDANGFRPLNTTTEVVRLTTANSLAAAPSGTNVRADSGTASAQTIASGGQTVNSYATSSNTNYPQTLTGTATAGAPGDVLTVTSGALVPYWALNLDNATLNFPNGGYLHLGDHMGVASNSRLTGSGGMTVTSYSGSGYRVNFTNTPTGGNTFTGGLYLNGNTGASFTLNNQLGNNAGALAAGDIVLGGGQLLYIPAAAATVSLNDGASARSIKVNESNGTIGTAFAAAVLQVPGVISGAGQVQFGGGASASSTGVVELTNSAANTYTGGTLISTGILLISNPNQLGTGPVLLNGGTLRAGGNLTFSSAVTATLSSTIDTQAHDVTLTGGLASVSGAVTLTKTGAGKLTINGTSTSTAFVSINAGTLAVDGSLPYGAITVNNAAATLSGVGTVRNFFLSAGSVAPGTATTAGRLSSGNVNFNSGTFAIDIGGTTAGTGHDQVSVTGTVTLSGAVPTFTAISSFVPSGTQTFVIIANDGTDAVSGTFFGLAEGASIANFLGSGLPATISYVGGTGNDVVVSFSAVGVTVTDVSPSTGSTAGGTAVTITGTNFTGATSVTFDGLTAPISAITDTSITATTPPHAAGPVSVLVTTPSGTNEANTLFTYIAPPEAPTIGTATAGHQSASVAFTAPASDGGSAITGYTVTSSPGGFTGTGAASPITVSGLTNGTAYTFTVTATNGVGTSAPSAASNSVTPMFIPGFLESLNGWGWLPSAGRQHGGGKNDPWACAVTRLAAHAAPGLLWR